MLQSFGIKNPIVIVGANTNFEDLYVPEERFGEAHQGHGNERFYERIDEKWRCRETPNQGPKLYVTRSTLGPLPSRYACENHLERLLMNEGYEVYAPEKHTLDHQIKIILSAEKIIFAEGSALHLFSLTKQTYQISAVIQRREKLPPITVTQMDDRKGVRAVAINAVEKTRDAPLRGCHLSRAQLDFSIVRDELIKAQLIKGNDWEAPTTEDIGTYVRAWSCSAGPSYDFKRT